MYVYATSVRFRVYNIDKAVLYIIIRGIYLNNNITLVGNVPWLTRSRGIERGILPTHNKY